MYDMRKKEAMRNGLIDLIKFIPLDKINMVEIGSYAGESADIFASDPKTKTIWCVDPWLPGYDENDAASSTDFVTAASGVTAASDDTIAAVVSGERIGTKSWADDTGTCYMNPSMFGHAKLVD